MLLDRYASYGEAHGRASRERIDVPKVCEAIRRDHRVSTIAIQAGVKLKPAGKEWLGLCPFHNERTPSLTIFADDSRFWCFGCSASGDVIDFVQRAYRVTLFEAIDMLDGGALAELKQQRAPVQPKRDLREVANRIAGQASPIEGTPAELYLRNRAITMPLPHTLRFARLAPPKNSGLLTTNGPGLLPCLVAIVTDPDGTLVGIQRTYVTEDGRKAATADGKVKFSLGLVAGGAIQLGAPAETVVVTEGLEDGLSLAQALGESVWVAAGTSMLPHMSFASVTRSVVIGADADEAGERAAQKAAEAYRDAQLAVRIMRPPAPWKDWNALAMEVRA
ncbi:toprim domain-containing protein [Sphingomonas sp. RHCKR7]|uniref:DUF7146 domain-containing protein n=1 Tax=Sphingomonas folli TaxID=2862497 RepID=UPI001CA531AB|nr:CHC2 zinc finger domain-containing protein [Sphingomonas folli]MBW6528723.1 toprim domain-containing protein [Sphingomonas folli]